MIGKRTASLSRGVSIASPIMKRPIASDFRQEILDLYDDYAHGRIKGAAFSNAPPVSSRVA